MFNSLGPTMFCHAYHMNHDSFWQLYHILLPFITASQEGWNKFENAKDYQVKGGRAGGNHILPTFPNGQIVSSIKLALHCIILLATHLAYCTLFVIAYQDVISSVWIIVHAIHLCADFTSDPKENSSWFPTSKYSWN